MRKTIYFILGFLIGISFISAPAMAYTVVSGDSLWKIAQKSNLSLSELINLNPQIANPSLIYPGQEVNTAVNTDLPYFQKLGEGMLGGNNINFVQVQNLYLSGSGISATKDTIGLTSFKYPVNGLNVVMSDFGSVGYAVIEPDSPREENISFTGITQNANGSATLTGVSRGLGLSYPYTASTTLASAHAGGSLLRISNTAPFYNEFNIKGKDETITGKWTFTTFPEFTSSLTPTTSEQFATKRYVDNVINQGAATSTEDVAGISELATQKEMASSTWDGVNVPRTIQSRYATSSPNQTDNPGIYVPTSEDNGYLSWNWLDKSQDITWTGNNTFSGTNTFSADSQMASSTITKALIGNATSTGTLYSNSLGLNNEYITSWGSKRVYTSLIPVTLENSNTLTTLYSFTLPGGYLGTNNLLHIKVPISDFDYEGTSAGGGNFTISLVYDDTTVFNVVASSNSDAATDDYQGYFEAYISASSSTALQRGYGWSQVFASGITDGTGSKEGYTASNIGTAAEDSTTDKVIYIKAKWAAADAQSVITTSGCFAEIIR